MYAAPSSCFACKEVGHLDKRMYKEPRVQKTNDMLKPCKLFGDAHMDMRRSRVIYTSGTSARCPGAQLAGVCRISVRLKDFKLTYLQIPQMIMYRDEVEDLCQTRDSAPWLSANAEAIVRHDIDKTIVLNIELGQTM